MPICKQCGAKYEFWNNELFSGKCNKCTKFDPDKDANWHGANYQPDLSNEQNASKALGISAVILFISTSIIILIAIAAQSAIIALVGCLIAGCILLAAIRESMAAAIIVLTFVAIGILVSLFVSLPSNARFCGGGFCIMMGSAAAAVVGAISKLKELRGNKSVEKDALGKVLPTSKNLPNKRKAAAPEAAKQIPPETAPQQKPSPPPLPPQIPTPSLTAQTAGPTQPFPGQTEMTSIITKYVPDLQEEAEAKVNSAPQMADKTNKSVKARLHELEELKSSGLVSEQEYIAMRKAILGEIAKLNPALV